MMKRRAAVLWILVLGGVVLGSVGLVWGGEWVAQTDRGAVVETERLRVEFRDGALVGLTNRLTGEAYLDAAVALARIQPHLPSGLGIQHGEPARAAAEKLHKWPWWEHPNDLHWPNQHYADRESRFTYEALAEGGALLAYHGLTDGRTRYPDETYTLALELDAETGDLLVTPGGTSPREGVYAASLTLAPLAPAVSAEAPIADGLRITRQNTGDVLWMNKWPNYWQYGFVAFNGWKRGAVAIWAQDKRLRHYKNLCYLKNGEGLSFAFSMMNIPPFETLTEAGGPLPWRIQAFAKSWGEAAERYRQWRDENVRLAPRPEFAKHTSFIASIAGSQERWLQQLVDYTKPWQHRAAAFQTCVRKQPFDRNHADNTPQDAFKADNARWREAGTYGMAYLQPMILWGPFPEKDEEMVDPEREKAARRLHREADTRSAFQKDPDTVVRNIDQHHLGHPGWQRWFLDWIHEWCQDYGAQGIYHDQSYQAPLDRRGLAIGGMTTPEGMADYFTKAATENPGTFHGTEMITECNAVAVANSIGSGYHWGTAPNMRLARAYDTSPVTAALCSPHTVLWSFVRLRGDSTWDLRTRRMQEARGQIAGAIDGPFHYRVDAKWFPALCNTPWHDRTRDVTFLKHGLRPVYPADYSRMVLSYFRGAGGEDFRYEKTDYGSRFVEVGADGARRTVYGVATGTQAVALDGVGIAGWLVYNDEDPGHTWNRTGPAGLHPDRFYVLDPTVGRPPVYFSTDNGYGPSFYEAYVADSAYNDTFAFIKLRTIEDLGAVTGWERLTLHSPAAPKAVYVNGKLTALKEKGEGTGLYPLSVKAPADIVVLLKDPPADLRDLHEAALARVTEVETPVDYYRPEALAGLIDGGTDVAGRPVLQDAAVSPFGFQFGSRKRLYVPLAAPAGGKGGAMRLHLPRLKKYGQQWNHRIVRVELNFQPQAVSHETEAKEVVLDGARREGTEQVKSGPLAIPAVLDIPLAPGEVKLLSLETQPCVGASFNDCTKVTTKLALEWVAKEE